MARCCCWLLYGTALPFAFPPLFPLANTIPPRLPRLAAAAADWGPALILARSCGCCCCCCCPWGCAFAYALAPDEVAEGKAGAAPPLGVVCPPPWEGIGGGVAPLLAEDARGTFPLDPKRERRRLRLPGRLGAAVLVVFCDLVVVEEAEDEREGAIGVEGLACC